MIIALIPCRLESKRLSKKALLRLEGIPIITHVLKRSLLCKHLDKVVVCTDNNQIISEVKKNKGLYFRSKKKHENGTERIAEFPINKKIKFIIDIQADEPLFNPKSIKELITFHKKHDHYDIVVPSIKLNKGNNKNEVKIISNEQGDVLYLTRSESPFEFKSKVPYFQKHLSIISFKPKALKRFSKLNKSKLEKIEGIELLRALENDFKIGTFLSKHTSQAVDVKNDYLKAKRIMKKDKIKKLYI